MESWVGPGDEAMDSAQCKDMVAKSRHLYFDFDFVTLRFSFNWGYPTFLLIRTESVIDTANSTESVIDTMNQ